jgi:hypothetical protein
MILKALLSTRVLIRSNKFLNSKGRLSNYTPPPSQYDTFKHHLEKIDEEISKRQAADMLAKL